MCDVVAHKRKRATNSVLCGEFVMLVSIVVTWSESMP